LAPIPELPINFRDIVVYPNQWIDFYRDHFGFRNTLIRAAAIARLQALAQDIDGSVLIGKNGWLFLRPEADPNFIAFRGLNPLSEKQLDAWQQLLEHRNAWLTARGIPFLVVIPPDKQTIYTEFLPPSAAPLVPRSYLDQLINRLRQTHSPVHLLDLRPALIAAKSTGQLYYKTDSHWNDLGAYYAYRAILNALNQIQPNWEFTPQPLDNFKVEPHIFVSGDLARITHVSRQIPETIYTLTPKTPPIPTSPSNNSPTKPTQSTQSQLPRLVVIRDSFFDAMVPMFDPHFSHTFYSHHTQKMDFHLIEQQNPQLVIDEFVERFLYPDPPTDPDPPPLNDQPMTRKNIALKSQ
jgi:alginate O-acetyltransferase complex protein AlgJ